MASEYRIHKPYVLATLPRPLDHTEGRIVAREVYGQRDGQKKRKRTELVVGVDGETASLYDVPASRLITSYPIPPQESFTCPPYSVRVRRAGSSDVSRYTYIATRDSTGQKLTVFKDVVHPDGKTTSTTTSQALRTSPVHFITCASSVSEVSNIGDVLVVCQDGEFVSLSGDSLAIHWTASSKAVVQDSVATHMKEFEVEYVASGTSAEFSEGIFKDRPEVLGAPPQSTSSEPELLVLVSRSFIQGEETRHLVVLAAASGTSTSTSDTQKLAPLEIVPIASTKHEGSQGTTYQVDVQAGLLFQLKQGSLSVYDLTSAVPKLKSVVQMDDSLTFARLSRPFVLSCSLDSIGLYNHQYRSIHANAPLDLSELPVENQQPRTCQLISYLRSQELVVALVDNVLVSIQVEPPKSHGKRRKQGLLIDSIGRGAAIEIPAKKVKLEKSSGEFSRQVPGTMNEEYLVKYHSEIQTADELLGQNDVAQWEALLRKRFRMTLRSAPEATNGSIVKQEETSGSQELPEWDWLPNPTSYSAVDRRWVIYAIGRVFSITLTESDEPRPQLRLILPDSNVASYLVVAGHLTLSNVKSAFRDEFDAEVLDSKDLANDLLSCLNDADPSMTLLLNYLQSTKLGEVELLLSIRALMLNMDLIADPKKPSAKLLKNEPEDGAEDYEMDLDDLEREIAITEIYLGDESSSPLRATLKTEEILSLVYMLRVELVRGAWTSLYIDPTSFDAEGNDPPPDGVIALIADLLGRCLDAIGAGGWLFNDAISSADKADAGDFLTALKLEVTAALEGLEEAVYLNGIVGEAVRYGVAAQKGGSARQVWNTNKPISMQLEGRESRLLPLGLKTKQVPTKDKIVSGGEVVQRTLRETGHLISQKVEAYSLEKLAI
ncbi:hypothetical protein G7046_g7035 [Stylonectria norvegica]|nr:hypothetical protein G7046_g7035 [Stylonectria norvegica]